MEYDDNDDEWREKRRKESPKRREETEEKTHSRFRTPVEMENTEREMRC